MMNNDESINNAAFLRLGRTNKLDTVTDPQVNGSGGVIAGTGDNPRGRYSLHFHMAGLKATDEMVAIALLDVGKPNASILYVSIPGTHRQYDYVIDQLLASVRPT